MSAAVQLIRLSPEEYLEAEVDASQSHEYIGGQVFAMAGGSREHNQIVRNLLLALSGPVDQRNCFLYFSDVKVRIRARDYEVFYYPDLVVTCDSRDTQTHYLEHPGLIVEVLSESTKRTDQFEKFHHYTQLDSVEEYMLVAQDAVEVTIHRRADGWTPEKYADLADEVEIRTIGARISVREIYRRIMVSGS